jgi:hypothetical protein
MATATETSQATTMLEPPRTPCQIQPIRSARASESSREASRAASPAWRQLAEAATLAAAAARWTSAARSRAAATAGSWGSLRPVAQAPRRSSAARSRILAARRGRKWTTISSSRSSSAARSRWRGAERLAREATGARAWGVCGSAAVPDPGGWVAVVAPAVGRAWGRGGASVEARRSWAARWAARGVASMGGAGRPVRWSATARPRAMRARRWARRRRGSLAHRPMARPAARTAAAAAAGAVGRSARRRGGAGSWGGRRLLISPSAW